MSRRGLNVFLSDEGGLLFDPQQVVDAAAPHYEAAAPLGSWIAQKAGIPLYAALGGHVIDLVSVDDVPDLMAAARGETAKAKAQRGAYENYLTRRRTKRHAKAVEAARIERQNYEAEELALQRGLHESYLAEKAGAEAAKARAAAAHPETVADLDLTAWTEAGEPEDVELPAVEPEPVDANEGAIV